MTRPRVLVVEDRPSVLKVIATILAQGYDVTTSSDGPGALSVLESDVFDVVLTDIRMPGASGFEVLRAVQSRAPGTMVVMMTAYANVTDAVSAMKLGAFDYVAKPLDADEIALVVARAVAQRAGVSEGDATTASGSAEDPRAGDLSKGFHAVVEEARDRASRDYLVRLMRSFQGNVTHAAKQAAMTRESLHRVLKRYGVHSEAYRDETGDGEGSDEPSAPRSPHL